MNHSVLYGQPDSGTSATTYVIHPCPEIQITMIQNRPVAMALINIHACIQDLCFKYKYCPIYTNTRNSQQAHYVEITLNQR
jgi:hypothetical protein